MQTRVPFLYAMLTLVLLPLSAAPFWGRGFAPEARFAAQTPVVGQRQLVLEWPEVLRQQDSSTVALTISEAADNTDRYAAYHVMAVARLEMTGLETDRYEIHEPLGLANAPAFRWKVRAQEPGVYQGTVWLRLLLTPRSGGAAEEVVVLASPIEIEVVQVFGLPAPLARILGAAGLVLSIILALPGLWPLAAARFRRRISSSAHQGGR